MCQLSLNYVKKYRWLNLTSIDKLPKSIIIIIIIKKMHLRGTWCLINQVNIILIIMNIICDIDVYIRGTNVTHILIFISNLLLQDIISFYV